MRFFRKNRAQNIQEFHDDTLSKGKSYLKMNGIAFLCLFLYVAAVFVGGIIADLSNLWKLLFAPMLFCALVFSLAIDRFCGFALKRGMKEEVSAKERRLTFILSFALTFGVLALYFYVFYPGSFSTDSKEQLAQVLTGRYSDWHPFIHTFLFFTVPLRIFGKQEMIVLLQILYFALSFAYLIMTIRRYACPRWLCAACVLIVALAPATGNIMMHPWKDCALAIFSSIATAHYVHIILTKGVWLDRKRNKIACGIVWALTALVRHNAVLFVLPIIGVALWFGRENKKRLISALIVFLVASFFVKVPLYSAFSVEKPGKRLVETTGMCMTVMGNVAAKNPDSLDAETAEFIYKVAPKEIWESKYETGSFNLVKFEDETNVNVIEEAGLKNLFKYTLRTLKADAVHSLEAFFKLTGMVWRLDGIVPWGWTLRAQIDLSRQETTANYFLKSWEAAVENSVLRYPLNYNFVGWMDLALIAFSLALIKKRSDIKNAFVAAPLLCHNFGTALLLTGFDWRFFYLTFPVAIPMLFLLIKTSQEGERE